MCCLKSGKCLVAQPPFGSLLGLNCSHWSEGRWRRACGCPAGRRHRKDNASEHSDDKSVVAPQTPDFEGQVALTVMAKCSRGGHYQLVGIDFWRNQNAFHLRLVSSPCYTWGCHGLTNSVTCPLVINSPWLLTSGHNLFLDSHFWGASWEHLKCVYLPITSQFFFFFKRRACPNRKIIHDRHWICLSYDFLHLLVIEKGRVKHVDPSFLLECKFLGDERTYLLSVFRGTLNVPRLCMFSKLSVAALVV